MLMVHTCSPAVTTLAAPNSGSVSEPVTRPVRASRRHSRSRVVARSVACTHTVVPSRVQATDRATTRDRLWRIDARTGHVTGSLTLPEFGAGDVVTTGKQVWTMSVGGDLQVALKKG